MKLRSKFYSKKFAKNNSSQRLVKVEKVFQDHFFKRILDIGCGDGSFSVRLKNYSQEVYGLDIAKQAVKIAQKKGIKAYQLDVENQKLPFKANFFEALYCGEILEHLFNPDYLLDEVHRVLKPGGLLVVTTPNLSWWLNRLVLLFGFQPYLTEVSLKYNLGKFKPDSNQVAGHIRAFTYKALKELLKIHHFEILKILNNDVAKSLPFPVNLLEKGFSFWPNLNHSNIFVLKNIC